MREIVTIFASQKLQICLLERHIDTLMTTHLLLILNINKEKNFHHKNSILSGMFPLIEKHLVVVLVFVTLTLNLSVWVVSTLQTFSKNIVA